MKVLIACTATFGAALGFYRGGAQILFAALKLPLVTLVTLAVVAPLLHLLNRALERPANMARDVSALVAALARGALVLAAETPLIWAAHAVGAGYHRMILITVLACARRGRGELLVPVGRPVVDAPVTLARGADRAHHRRDRGRAGHLVVPTLSRAAARGRRGLHAPPGRLVLGSAGGQHRIGARALSQLRGRRDAARGSRDERARVHVGGPGPVRDGRRRLRRWRPETRPPRLGRGATPPSRSRCGRCGCRCGWARRSRRRPCPPRRPRCRRRTRRRRRC